MCSRQIQCLYKSNARFRSHSSNFDSMCSNDEISLVIHQARLNFFHLITCKIKRGIHTVYTKILKVLGIEKSFLHSYDFSEGLNLLSITLQVSIIIPVYGISVKYYPVKPVLLTIYLHRHLKRLIIS